MHDDEIFQDKRSLIRAHPLTAEDIVTLSSLAAKPTRDAAVDIEIRRGGKRTSGRLTRMKVTAALAEGWDDLALTLSANHFEVPIIFWCRIEQSGRKIELDVQRGEERQATQIVETIIARLKLQEAPQKQYITDQFERHVGVSMTPDKVRVVLGTIARATSDKVVDLSISRRGQDKKWPVTEAELKVALGESETFQDIDFIKGAFEAPGFDGNWWVQLPLGRVFVVATMDHDRSKLRKLERDLDAVLRFQKVPRKKQEYRTGTLLFEINRWSKDRLSDALALVNSNLAHITATPSQLRQNAPTPQPLLDRAFQTREGKSGERFGGPVEVLEPVFSFAAFLKMVQKKDQTIRVIEITIEGPLASVLTISVNVEESRVMLWSGMEIDEVLRIVSPLVDYLKLKLIESKAGSSLQQTANFLEAATNQFTLLSQLWTPIKFAAAGLGITTIGSGISWFLLGFTAVEVTHSVRNDGVFEGAPVQALVIDWELNRPVIRRVFESVGGAPVPDTVNLIVYKNGEKVVALSKPAQPGTTLALDAEKYRIDLDHAAPRIHDASFYVNIAEDKPASELSRHAARFHQRLTSTTTLPVALRVRSRSSASFA